MASAVRAGSDLIGRLARIGSLPDDSPDEALKKQTLLLVACTITALSVVWVLTSFDRPDPAWLRGDPSC
jgi:hypothetical protein